MSPLRFYIYEHQHKAKPYIQALEKAGYRSKRRMINVDFAMLDHEWDGLFAGYSTDRQRIEVIDAGKLEIPVFVYPHSVRPNIPFDLTDNYYPSITALFTIAEGHREILKRLNYPNPIEVVGWPYTEIRSFKHKKTNDKIRVLFAPVHPVGGKYLPEIDKELNANIYTLLLELLDKIDLTVRYVGALENNNLWLDQRVRFIEGKFDGSTAEMERADVVIGAYTYAHMAVALGHPLVMMGEGVKPHNSPRSGGQLIWAKNWEKYKDYMAYPFNVEGCQISEDLYDILRMAREDNLGVENWKQRFIGEPFNGQLFVKTLESYL